MKRPTKYYLFILFFPLSFPTLLTCGSDADDDNDDDDDVGDNDGNDDDYHEYS